MTRYEKTGAAALMDFRLALKAKGISTKVLSPNIMEFSWLNTSGGAITYHMATTDLGRAFLVGIVAKQDTFEGFEELGGRGGSGS